MKLIHVPFCFHPEPVGGTEVYLESLAKEQKRMGFEVLVAAPGAKYENYFHNGIKVWRLPVNQAIRDVAEMYGSGDPLAAEAFGRILDEEAPDLVHMHAFTRGASLRVVREAKRRKLPVIFSYHTPTVSCQRGTLMRWGLEICDGVVDVERCSQCALHGLGLNKAVSKALGSAPQGIGRLAGSAGLSGGFWTALRMTELVAIRTEAFRALMEEVDHIVALCDWVKEVLLRNGVPPEKVTVCRQGLCHPDEPSLAQDETESSRSSALRIAFLGRLDPTKGAHILIEALRQAPELPVELDIYGIAQGAAGAAYLRRLKQLADGDQRITFRDPIPASKVVNLLRAYDVLAVPSQLLETGPMVILEAFAAGIPVIGSALGGIAELVTNGVDGAVGRPSVRGCVAAGDGERERALISLRAAIRQPRKIGVVAEEMAALYSDHSQKHAVTQCFRK